MVAPCIVRLDKAIADADCLQSQAQLMAEKGCYLARIGDFVQADNIRKQLRTALGDDRDLRTSVYIMILEGLLSYFKNLGGDARDRLLRAQFLSNAANDQELLALTSAWLGHIDFNEGRIGLSVERAKKAVDSIQEGQLPAVIRVALLLGDLFLTAGNQKSSRLWYGVARHAAVEYGDQAAIGAITYNQAALRVFDLRIRSAMGADVQQSAIDSTDAEFRTAANYQIVSGATSLDHLLVGTKIGVCLLQEDFLRASQLLNALLAGAEVPVGYAYRSVLQSDALYCAVRLGDGRAAKRFAKDLGGIDLNQLPIDDRILVSSNFNRSIDLDPEAFSESLQKVDMNELVARYLAQKSNMDKDLQPLAEIPSNLPWLTASSISARKS